MLYLCYHCGGWEFVTSNINLHTIGIRKSCALRFVLSGRLFLRQYIVEKLGKLRQVY